MVSTGGALICTRRPANTATPKSPVDENYVISIAGNPETYILGQEYNGKRVGSLTLRLNFNVRLLSVYTYLEIRSKISQYFVL